MAVPAHSQVVDRCAGESRGIGTRRDADPDLALTFEGTSGFSRSLNAGLGPLRHDRRSRPLWDYDKWCWATLRFDAWVSRR